METCYNVNNIAIAILYFSRIQVWLNCWFHSFRIETDFFNHYSFHYRQFFMPPQIYHITFKIEKKNACYIIRLTTLHKTMPQENISHYRFMRIFNDKNTHKKKLCKFCFSSFYFVIIHFIFGWKKDSLFFIRFIFV